MKKLELSIKTTSECQRRCKNCSVIPWMDANKGFHTSIKQIENLIKYSKESEYHWEYILLSGGEPLLWKNIVEGTKLLYESGITSRLILLTNGLYITTKTLDKVKKIIANVHEFRISRYSDNHRNIELAEEYFGNLRNGYDYNVLNIVDRQHHLIAPAKPIKDSLPATCSCKALSMVGGEIHLCGPAHTIACRFPERFKDLSDILWFRQPTKNLELKYNREYCQYCISNAKVAKTLKKEKS